MKVHRVIIALAIGVLVSTALQVMGWLTDDSLFWMGWETPGISAAFLFWGALGSSVFVGVAIAWVVNAIVYGMAAFGVLTIFRLLTLALPK
jgi:hypothetical protein